MSTRRQFGVAVLGSVAQLWLLTLGTAPSNAALLVVNVGTADVVSIDALGNQSVFATSVGLSPRGITTDAAGNVYVSDYLASLITKYSPSGTPLGTYSSTQSGPMGMAFIASGDMLVANFFNDTVHRLSPSGADLGVFAKPNLSQPVGVAIGPGGSVYVANQNNSSVAEFSPVGGFITSSMAGLIQPEGIAVDASGNVYVADYSANQVHKFSPALGDLGVFASAGLDGPSASRSMRTGVCS